MLNKIILYFYVFLYYTGFVLGICYRPFSVGFKKGFDHYDEKQLVVSLKKKGFDDESIERTLNLRT